MFSHDSPSFSTVPTVFDSIKFRVREIEGRSQISERVSANFGARAKRGLFNGGAVPYGYKKDPERRGHLLINPDEASVVRHAFTALIREGSLMPAARWLNANQFGLARVRTNGRRLTRSGNFTVDNLQRIIRTRMYLGLRTYKCHEGEDQEVKAAWDPIVDPEVFKMANDVLSKNKMTHRRNHEGKNSRFPFLLSTLVHCKKCHDKMSGKSAHGRSEKIPYYEHGWATKKGSHIPGLKHDCAPYRVLAKQIEPVVWQEIERLLTTNEFARELLENARTALKKNPGSKEADRFRHDLVLATQKLETLSERLASLPKSVCAEPIYHQMEKLEATKKEAGRNLAQLEIDGVSMGKPSELRNFDEFRKSLRVFLEKKSTPETKAKIARFLIRSIGIHEGGFDIHWAVSDTYVRSCLVSFEEKGGKFERVYAEQNLHKNFGSNTLTNGGESGI